MFYIILEGENKTGKSTLALELKKRFEEEKMTVDILKCSQPKKDAFKEYIDKISESDKDIIIIDRFAYGELVYGPLYRGESQITYEQLKQIEKRISGRAVIIYCWDMNSKITERFEEDKEEFADISKIEKTQMLYEKVIARASLPVIKYRMKVTYPIIIFNEIKKYAKI